MEGTNTLLIIRGLPGSGKTTLAKKLTPVAVAADDYPPLYTNGKYHRQHQRAAHKWCKQQVEEFMKQGHPLVAVHNTFVKRYQVQVYIDLALTHGYQPTVITCEGDYGSVHSIPHATMTRFTEEWQPWVPPKLERSRMEDLIAEAQRLGLTEEQVSAYGSLRRKDTWFKALEQIEANAAQAQDAVCLISCS